MTVEFYAFLIAFKIPVSEKNKKTEMGIFLQGFPRFHRLYY